ncbi:MAG: hypothetical protein JO211_09385 [Acidobacteriaceae bacterium]|nr:hypothetical protein [Acidobacteriaceae bacterium]
MWFSTTNGLVVVDPNHLVSNKIAPAVQMTAILINGRRADLSQPIDLKPFERNVEIRYAALSFVSPEKASFRYILDGYDKTWTDAGVRREAFFTNLPPGKFQFKVMARNADGISSTYPAVLKFAIEPRFYQRIWFFPALALAVALAVILGYRMRIQQLRKRFDLVLAERSRIARELHDTLLQGLSGITLQLQALWTRLPVSKEKQFLREIIQDAGRCSTEARHSLWGLRAVGTASLEFSEKLAKLARDAVSGKRISLTLSLQPISLREYPEVEYQLLRIAQEAISNALIHSHARNLQICASLQENELELTFEDNGVGFENDCRQPFGHFGLVGMRERAEEIGAEMLTESFPGRGTKISIRLQLSQSDPSERNAELGLEHQIREV